MESEDFEINLGNSFTNIRKSSQEDFIELLEAKESGKWQKESCHSQENYAHSYYSGKKEVQTE